MRLFIEVQSMAVKYKLPLSPNGAASQLHWCQKDYAVIECNSRATKAPQVGHCKTTKSNSVMGGVICGHNSCIESRYKRVPLHCRIYPVAAWSISCKAVKNEVQSIIRFKLAKERIRKHLLHNNSLKPDAFIYT